MATFCGGTTGNGYDYCDYGVTIPGWNDPANTLKIGDTLTLVTHESRPDKVGFELPNWSGLAVCYTDQPWGQWKPGDRVEVIAFSPPNNVTLRWKTGWSRASGTSEGTNMTGKIFDAVVVRTTSVPAGEGCTSCKEVSKVVFTADPFSAVSEDAARGLVIAAALEAVAIIPEQLADAVSPIEVKLRAWS